LENLTSTFAWVWEKCWRAGNPDIEGTTYHEGGIFNSNSVPYPQVQVQGYGYVPFPSGSISRVSPSPPALRSAFNSIRNSGDFKTWWEGQGRPWPTPTEGSRIDIHHIQPLGHGGTNAFENLVPLDYNTQHKLFTRWWINY
jgi:hypothetical protein